MYKPYAEQLVRDGWAYYAFDTPEELDAKRKEAESQKKTFQYDAHTRMGMVNSLTLSAEEVAARLASGNPYVVRFKYPADTDIHVQDLIRGEVVINSNLLDDKVLYIKFCYWIFFRRSPGLPFFSHTPLPSHPLHPPLEPSTPLAGMGSSTSLRQSQVLS